MEFAHVFLPVIPPMAALNHSAAMTILLDDGANVGINQTFSWAWLTLAGHPTTSIPLNFYGIPKTHRQALRGCLF